MKYRFYIVWVDGSKDSYYVGSTAEKDYEIKEMIASKEITEITYCPVYKNGEYGKKIKVL